MTNAYLIVSTLGTIIYHKCLLYSYIHQSKWLFWLGNDSVQSWSSANSQALGLSFSARLMLAIIAKAKSFNIFATSKYY